MALSEATGSRGELEEKRKLPCKITESFLEGKTEPKGRKEGK